jgi:hypothetical protein
MRIEYFANIARGVCLTVALGCFATAASAGPADIGRDLHGRDLQSLNPAERDVWQSGKWVHTTHDGHSAWWWTAGGYWYYYQRPTYPSPQYVASFSMVGQSPPVVDALSSGPSWFYCDQPSGYTPYISSCVGNWHQVAVSPSVVAAE